MANSLNKKNVTMTHKNLTYRRNPLYVFKLSKNYKTFFLSGFSRN